MHVILAEVRSLDGKLTDTSGHPPNTWASKEDQKQFRELIRTSDAVIVGRNTYEVQKDAFSIVAHTLRIVMTKDADFYAKETVPGHLEFSSLSPRALLKKLEREGVKQILLASGPKLTKAFLSEKLVDELWLTIEPVNFTGGSVKTHPYANLKLLESKILNKAGTHLLIYEFLR